MQRLDDLKSNELPDPKTLEGFDKLDTLQQLAAKNIHRALMACSTFGVISDEQLKGNILDFGCGGGGSTWYLSKIGGDVRAVDKSEEDTRELKQLNCIPEVNITTGDGIQLMNSLPESSLDIVTATMLGPDSSGDLVIPFLEAARRVIKKDGWILIFSEIGTLSTIRNITRGRGIVDIDNNTLLAAKITPDKRPDFDTSFDFPDLGFGKETIAPIIPSGKKHYFSDLELDDSDIRKIDFAALFAAFYNKPGGSDDKK